MRRSVLLAAVAGSLTLLLAACGSSAKNNNSATKAPDAVAATLAASGSQATAARAAAGASTVAPSAAATVVSGAPSAAATRNAAAPAASVAASSAAAPANAAATVDPCTAVLPTVTNGTPDATVAAALAKSGLANSDVPSGYTGLPAIATASANVPLIYPDETASYTNIFTKGGPAGAAAASPYGGDSIIEGLLGFSSSNSASTLLKQLVRQAAAAGCAGGNASVQQISSPGLGEESQTYKLSLTVGTQKVTGFAVIWRHGKVDAFMEQFGPSDVTSPDDLVALAKKLDGNLKSNGF